MLGEWENAKVPLMPSNISFLHKGMIVRTYQVRAYTMICICGGGQ